MKNPVLALMITITIALVSIPSQAQTTGFDLPIKPVKFGDRPPSPPTVSPIPGRPPIVIPAGNTGPPAPDDDDGDDPRDTPPPVFYGEEIEVETDSIFYVIDTSGSMNMDNASYTALDGSIVSGTKFDRAKAELKRSIAGLSDNFEFNVISYSCWINVWSMKMQQATQASKGAAYAWIDARSTSGGTATGPATAGALTFRDNYCVVLLTDGEPNCGGNTFEDHRRMIRSANMQHAVVNVFGIAATGSYRSFCQGVANDSGGQYFDLP